MRRRNKSSHRTFNAHDYWASRPFCTVCRVRQTRQGTVCHKCRKAGHVEPEVVLVPPLDSNASASSPIAKTTVNANATTQNAQGCGVLIAIAVGLLVAFVWIQAAQQNRSTSSPAPSSPYTGDVYVRGYTRSDGTYVAPHHRTQQNQIFGDNYSTSGNSNPYTGKAGTRHNPPKLGTYFDK